MKIAMRLLILVFLPAVLLGCRQPGSLLSPPGTMHQQQLKATVYDPYTEPDVGPEVVGGRPRDYQKPLAEPVRSRTVRDSLNR